MSKSCIFLQGTNFSIISLLNFQPFYLFQNLYCNVRKRQILETLRYVIIIISYSDVKQKEICKQTYLQPTASEQNMSIRTVRLLNTLRVQWTAFTQLRWRNRNLKILLGTGTAPDFVEWPFFVNLPLSYLSLIYI